MRIKDVVDTIKNRRIQLGMSQTELAKLSGVSKQVINNWERDSNNYTPMSITFIKVCLILGLEISDFIEE